MNETKRAVRTNLSQAEWLLMKLAATRQGIPIEQWVSALIRSALKGVKP